MVRCSSVDNTGVAGHGHPISRARLEIHVPSAFAKLWVEIKHLPCLAPSDVASRLGPLPPQPSWAACGTFACTGLWWLSGQSGRLARRQEHPLAHTLRHPLRPDCSHRLDSPQAGPQAAPLSQLPPALQLGEQRSRSLRRLWRHPRPPPAGAIASLKPAPPPAGALLRRPQLWLCHQFHRPQSWWLRQHRRQHRPHAQRAPLPQRG